MKGSHRTFERKGRSASWGRGVGVTDLGATGERMRGRVRVVGRHVVGVEVDGVKRQPRVGLVLIVRGHRARTVCALWEAGQVGVSGWHRETNTFRLGGMKLTTVAAVLVDLEEIELEDLTRRANCEKGVRTTRVRHRRKKKARQTRDWGRKGHEHTYIVRESEFGRVESTFWLCEI